MNKDRFAQLAGEWGHAWNGVKFFAAWENPFTDCVRLVYDVWTSGDDLHGLWPVLRMLP